SRRLVNIWLAFGGKTTAQFPTFCSVTDAPRMRLRNNVVLACVLSAKPLTLTNHLLPHRLSSQLVNIWLAF
ncbi:MAG: hypothetical protein IKA29_05085, partial [Clostridia bacterium]|nr:hypothetical protein [Clostridia bacterium]